MEAANGYRKETSESSRHSANASHSLRHSASSSAGHPDTSTGFRPINCLHDTIGAIQDAGCEAAQRVLNQAWADGMTAAGSTTSNSWFRALSAS